MFLKKVDGFVGSLLARVWLRPKQVGRALPSVSRLLLIRPGGIGDAVLLIPVVKRLRDTFPSACIEVLAERRNIGTFALCPEIDRILCYDKPQELLVVLRSDYDVVIDSEQWHRLSALVSRIIRSKLKIGYGTNERKRLFTHPIEYSHENYELNSFFELLKPLGIDLPATTHVPFLTIPVDDQAAADKLLRALSNQPFVVIFAGASIPEKKWPVTKFRSVVSFCMDIGCQVVLVGGVNDIEVSDAVARDLNVLNLCGRTSLVETSAVLARAALVICGDSGVLHIAVGLDRPTVALFGPSSVGKWAPAGSKHVAISKQLKCSPCSLFGTVSKCENGESCIREISVEEVTSVIPRLLDK
jgi:lipopolysaccharide heptosyltransferase II